MPGEGAVLRQLTLIIWFNIDYCINRKSVNPVLQIECPKNHMTKIQPSKKTVGTPVYKF